MRRTSALLLRVMGSTALVATIAACGSWERTVIEAPCRDHPDPADCQAALDAASADLEADPAVYEVSVSPIRCTDDGCTTYVSSIPIDEEACLPLGEVEVGQAPGGEWTVLSLSHGDPPCAFEQ